LKLRFCAFFICLLVFVAAVDTIPDPRALTPPTKDSFGRLVDHALRAAPAPLHNSWTFAARVFQMYPMNWFSCRFAFDLLPEGDVPLRRITHAADSSPPFVS